MSNPNSVYVCVYIYTYYCSSLAFLYLEQGLEKKVDYICTLVATYNVKFKLKLLVAIYVRIWHYSS